MSTTGGLLSSMTELFREARVQSDRLIKVTETLYVRGAAMFFVAARPPKKRTHAADRTRSPRWRAGSRRTRRQGLRTRRVRSWEELGWTPLGYTTDPSPDGGDL